MRRLLRGDAGRGGRAQGRVMAGRPRHSDDQRAAVVAAILDGVSAPKAAEAAARGELGDLFTVLGSSVRRWRRSWRARCPSSDRWFRPGRCRRGRGCRRSSRRSGRRTRAAGPTVAWRAAGARCVGRCDDRAGCRPAGCRVVSMTSLSARVWRRGAAVRARGRQRWRSSASPPNPPVPDALSLHQGPRRGGAASTCAGLGGSGILRSIPRGIPSPALFPWSRPAPGKYLAAVDQPRTTACPDASGA